MIDFYGITTYIGLFYALRFVNHVHCTFWSLRNYRFFQISRTLLSILADLNNAEIWMVSILPLFSNSSSLFSECLGTVPGAPFIIGITVTLMFHRLFLLSSKIRVFVCIFAFFYSELESGLSDPFVSQNHRKFYVSFSVVGALPISP